MLETLSDLARKEGELMANIKAMMWGIKQNNSKYQWPANKLGETEMAILHRWREKTQTPINHLLQQAIREMDNIIGK